MIGIEFEREIQPQSFGEIPKARLVFRSPLRCVLTTFYEKHRSVLFRYLLVMYVMYCESLMFPERSWLSRVRVPCRGERFAIIEAVRSLTLAFLHEYCDPFS